MSEAMTLVATVLGAGLFWTTITLWAVKTLLDRQAEATREAQVKQQADNRTEWARITQAQNENWTRLQETVQRIEAAERLNADDIHRLDLEHLRLRDEIHRDMQGAYVGREEFEELKRWIRDIHNAISHTTRAAPEASVVPKRESRAATRGNE